MPFFLLKLFFLYIGGTIMKKILVLLLVSLFTITIFAEVKIGITAIVEHPALDACREGVLDLLEEKGLLDGVIVDFQKAQGDMKIAKSIADQFVSDGVNLIVAIATPVAQACAGATKNIPIVFSAVTDPVGAGLIEKLGNNEGNIVGVSDMTPVLTQLQLLKFVLPDAVKVGFVLNPSEANSLTLLDLAKQAAEQLGMEVIEIPGSTTSEMITSMNALIDEVDAIYIGTDNTAASSIQSLGTIAKNAGVPIIAADIDIARGGGVIGFGFNYYKIGLKTGELVAEILKGTPVNELESGILSADSLDLYIDLDLASDLELELPESLIVKADFIVENGQETEIN